MSQDDYLGPQRGRTLLGELPYQYPKPTKEFRTLALTPQHRDETPAGNQHLRYDNAASGSGRRKPQMWDLVYDADAELYFVHNPIINVDRTSVTSAFTLTDAGIIPEAGSWAVLELTSAAGTSGSIELKSTWTDYPNAYSFAAGFMTEANIPLWRFYDEQNLEGTLTYFSADVYGQKLFSNGPVQLGHILVVDGTDVYSVPDFY